MRVTFPGVGEAFDESLTNTCVLIETEEHSALLDCGFNAPFAYWRMADRPARLDALWISHFHGDHFFGVPALLLRLHEEGRTKPLAVIGQRGVDEAITGATNFAYPGLWAKLGFDVEMIELEPGEVKDAAGFTWSDAENEHPRRSLGVRVEAEGKSVYYSGDGRPTPATRELAEDADLVVHEAFSLADGVEGHGTVAGAIAFARAVRARHLWIVHIHRDARHGRWTEIETLLREAADVEAFMPEPGDAIRL